MPLTKIIVPIDFSSTSAHALRYGYFLSDLTGYELEVVHVHDGYDGEEAFIFQKGNARIRSRVRARLEKFVALHADQITAVSEYDADDTLPSINSRELVGTTVDQLVKISKRTDTTMIVMGGVGSGTPGRVVPLFGSVARAVAMRTRCPVIFIPKNYGLPAIKHTAIAFDKVPALIELSKKSRFLRKALSPSIHFTHVLYQDKLSEEMMEQDLLYEVFVNKFPGYAVDFDHLPKGKIVNVLLDYALERNIDLLILGRRCRGFLMDLLIKSDIPDIVASCAVPLLLIPLTVRDRSVGVPNQQIG